MSAHKRRDENLTNAQLSTERLLNLVDIPTQLKIESPDDAVTLLFARFPGSPGAEERCSNSNSLFGYIISDKWDLPSFNPSLTDNPSLKKASASVKLARGMAKPVLQVGRLIPGLSSFSKDIMVSTNMITDRKGSVSTIGTHFRTREFISSHDDSTMLY